MTRVLFIFGGLSAYSHITRDLDGGFVQVVLRADALAQSFANQKNASCYAYIERERIACAHPNDGEVRYIKRSSGDE